MAAPETVGVVIGNHTHKYTARNPAIRLLTERWVANLDRTFGQVSRDRGRAAGAALEVGCGEGVVADRMHRRWGEVVALDLPDAGLRADWRRYRGPRFLHASAHRAAVRRQPLRRGGRGRGPGAPARPGPGAPGDGPGRPPPPGALGAAGNRSSAPATWSPAAMSATSATPPGTSTTGPRRSFVRFVSQVAEVRERHQPVPLDLRLGRPARRRGLAAGAARPAARPRTSRDRRARTAAATPPRTTVALGPWSAPRPAAGPGRPRGRRPRRGRPAAGTRRTRRPRTPRWPWPAAAGRRPPSWRGQHPDVHAVGQPGHQRPARRPQHPGGREHGRQRRPPDQPQPQGEEPVQHRRGDRQQRQRQRGQQPPVGVGRRPGPAAAR